MVGVIGGGQLAFPSPRSVRHALGVLVRLPAVLLPDVIETLIDRLDLLDGDLDCEEDNEDACPAEDRPIAGYHGIGDLDDAEPDVDDEPDDEDQELGSEDEPGFGPRRRRRNVQASGACWIMRCRPRGSVGEWETVL